MASDLDCKSHGPVDAAQGPTGGWIASYVHAALTGLP
jgi:hypothetical protein